MAKATFEELTSHARKIFLSLRVLGDGYRPALELLSETIQAIALRLPRIRSSKLTGIVEQQMKASAQKGRAKNLFSQSLSERLAQQSEKSLSQADDRRPLILELWAKLPSIDRTLLEAYYRQTSSELRVADHVAEFTRIHLDLLHQLDRSFPEPDATVTETNETDLARLILQRVIGNFPEDRHVILETLLVGEAGNQRFFSCLMVLVAELEWFLGSSPDWTLITVPEPIPLKERLVTWAFLIACGVAIVSVIYAVTR